MAERVNAFKPAVTADGVLQAAVDLLRKHDEGEIADRALRVRERPAPEGSVVVVGEVSRGKSSLVNALAGQPGLAPVDTEITTSVYVRFTPAAPELPLGTALIEFPGGTKRIDATELADWVTVAGRHAERTTPSTTDDPDDGPVGLPVTGARVAIASTLLPDAVIVDTPGVGSLVAEHVQAAVSAARGAGVLLMVCDATAPISAPELAFLSSISEEISSVVLAVTKIDLVMRQWRTIVAENRKLIAAHAPRFAHLPIIGVSNRIAEQAAAIIDPDRARSALDASGLTELARTLAPMVGGVDKSSTRNALQVAFIGLDDVRARLMLEVTATAAAPQVKAEVEAERERLQQLRARKQEWAHRLAQETTELGVAADDLLRDEFESLVAQWSTRIDKLKFYEPHRGSKELIGQMTVDLEAAARRVSEMFVAGVEKIADGLFEDTDIRSDVLARLTPADELALRDQQKVSPWKNMVDPILLSAMVAGGPLALIPGVNLVAVPIWSGIVVGFRASRVGKENHRKWLTKAANDMKTDLRSQLKAMNGQAVGELRIAYGALLEKRIAESTAIINEAAAESKRSVAQRQQAVNDLRTQVTAIDNVRKSIVAVTRPR